MKKVFLILCLLCSVSIAAMANVTTAYCTISRGIWENIGGCNPGNGDCFQSSNQQTDGYLQYDSQQGTLALFVAPGSQFAQEVGQVNIFDQDTQINPQVATQLGFGNTPIYIRQGSYDVIYLPFGWIEIVFLWYPYGGKI
jgi:hypothetical protein